MSLFVSLYAFLLVMGAIEIAAGIAVVLYPRIGAYIVAVWLWGTILNLVLVAGFCLALSLAALALARLAAGYGGMPILPP
jgi:hypothetical protein